METSFFQFNILELLSLIGLIQTIYVIVHLIGRAKDYQQVLIPVFLFIVLGSVFFMNVADRHWADGFVLFDKIKWVLWALIPSISALFIVQILRISKSPPIYLWIIPAFIPLVIFMPFTFLNAAEEAADLFNICALVIGAFNLLLIWVFRNDLAEISSRTNGKERFWIVISLILMNIGILSLYFVVLSGQIEPHQNSLIRVVLGLGFVYLGSTSLFRIYPYTIELKREKSQFDLSDDEHDIAQKIDKLINVDKIYQEPGYNRTDLAQELGVSESQLSRIVGQYYDKTVPQLFNEYRVKDAKSLLIETKADIATITYESGFNSVATFNRAFKNIVGQSPSEFRKKKRTER